ncbi:hypothetical protein MNBD_CHLOROFLEXI01-3875 [hydrothermal vent metagenome]|uniref:Uncharacterized protein n=1 Tax=hydrothermal vent metagenome TaxID=652676 RepID=A0A3B0V082_9ZZZZ
MNFLKCQKQSYKSWRQRPFNRTTALIFLLLLILAACSPEIETVTVEVTRVVTETVVEEGETVEVTRVVTETIIETVEVEAEAEPDDEPPSATGSEGDAGPLPPAPGDGSKVVAGRGSTQAAELIVETAVTLRASQPNATNIEQPTAIFSPISPSELQKWCQLIVKTHKKRCS